jgi:hypothetical protein
MEEKVMKRKFTLYAALFTLGLALLMPQAAFSQFFNAFQIDDTDYPYVKATYVAKDFVGNYFTDLTIDNFDILENGVSYDETLDMSCIKVDKEQPISVVLLMEASASMSNLIDGGESRMQWVMDATKKFIDSLKFEAPGGLYIIQHAGGSMRQSTWMTDRTVVSDFLLNSPVQPGIVDFEPALNAAIDQLKTRPNNMRKVIVSIFDGPPSQNHDLDFLGMSAKCQKENIEVYGVNLVVDADGEFYDFQTFSNLAGGNTKVIFSKKKNDLLDAMKTKAWQIQGYREVCQISWEASQPCNLSDINRNVKVLFQNGSIKDSAFLSYTAPEPPMLEFAEDLIYFGADQTFREANVEVSAKNKNVTITGVEFSDEGMFSAAISTPYLVQLDVPFAFTVEYTEDPISPPHIVEMSFLTEPCPTDNVIRLITNSSVEIEEEVDFDKVDIGEIAEMTFDCVLKNIMPVAVSGRCELTGNGINEMELIDGEGNFTLEPNECLDVTVKYTRQTGGIIDVKLEYGLPIVFGNPMTVITMDTSLTSVEDLISSGSFYLSDNYPNPAENTTSIDYFLPLPQPVYISVYNIYGELVATLVNGKVQSGSNKIDMNVSDLPSGVYIYELRTPLTSLQKRMIINR